MNSLSQNIIIQYLQWHFFEVPLEILKGWWNFLVFNLNYFSIPLLLKTFFSPWRRYQWSYPRGFSFGEYAETFFSNLISRSLGAIVRTIFICFALLMEVLIFCIGAIVFFVWIFLPFLLLATIGFGVSFII